MEGNVHYTNEGNHTNGDLRAAGDNSPYLPLKYKNKGIRGIPFIENMDVKVLAPDTIKIVVYEKAVPGTWNIWTSTCILTRTEPWWRPDAKTRRNPQVTEFRSTRWCFANPCRWTTRRYLRKYLHTTQILSKYEISADKIYFDDSYEMTLYFGDVRVKLGNMTTTWRRKFSRLKQILPAAAGTKGVFHMENYSGSGSNVTLNRINK